jgi:hypothetical protein
MDSPVFQSVIFADFLIEQDTKKLCRPDDKPHKRAGSKPQRQEDNKKDKKKQQCHHTEPRCYEKHQ